MNAVTTLLTQRDTREDDLKPLGAKILAHLRRRGSISPLEAMSTYGTMRLAAQIYDLREVGFTINSVEKKAEDGQKYTRYYYVDAPL
jgi:hypothetical protein